MIFLKIQLTIHGKFRYTAISWMRTEKRNAELFEEAFYGKKNLNPQMIDAGTEKMITVPDGVDAETLMKVLRNPKMVALLSSLAKTIQK
jgi:hypothetical protein